MPQLVINREGSNALVKRVAQRWQAIWTTLISLLFYSLSQEKGRLLPPLPLGARSRVKQALMSLYNTGCLSIGLTIRLYKLFDLMEA